MRKKLRMFLVVGAISAAMVLPAGPAQAGTCQVANPEIDAVVCGTYLRVMRTACTVADKLGGGCG